MPLKFFEVYEGESMFSELYRAYEEECRRLTEKARKLNPDVLKVEPVVYSLSADTVVGEHVTRKGCLHVHTKEEGLPFIYVIEWRTIERPMLHEDFEGREVFPGDRDPDLPLSWEEAKELYSDAEIRIYVDWSEWL